MRSLLIRCYPARWRARYGDEFEAILEERPLGPFDVADILLGALDAQLRLRGQRAATEHERGFTMTLRLGGFAAILGATLIALALLLISGAVVRIDRVVPSLLILTGSLALLVALAGMSAFQARAHTRLSWAALWLLVIATVSSTVGILVGLADASFEASFVWLMLGLLAAVIGSVLYGIVTYRALSTGAALLLVAAGVLLFVALAVTSNVNRGATVIGIEAFYPGIICFVAGWFVLGVQAIRLDRPATDPRPA
jgi:hypothetical protein